MFHPCKVCGIDTDRTIKGVPVHRECLLFKSVEVIKIEEEWHKPIGEVLSMVIRDHPIWPERCAALGVSKVTMYSWVRKYLSLNPQQAVRKLRTKSQFPSPPFELQTGYRDFLGDSSVFLVPC